MCRIRGNTMFFDMTTPKSTHLVYLDNL